MTWEERWETGQTGWKAEESSRAYEKSYELIAARGLLSQPASILVPLSGDGMFSPYAHTKGHSITCFELVGTAVRSLLDRFENTANVVLKPVQDTPGLKVFEGQRARVYQGDVFVPQESEFGCFDVIYDKDSFGAIPVERRGEYVALMHKYLKCGGSVFLEGKSRADDQVNGPPFHLTDDIIENIWCAHGFKKLEWLPEIYPISRPNWTQQAFVLVKA